MAVQAPDADFHTSGLFVSLLLVLFCCSCGMTVMLWMLSLFTLGWLSALTGNHLHARQSIREGLCDHELELLILH